jgi:hypothetical protein
MSERNFFFFKEHRQFVFFTRDHRNWSYSFSITKKLFKLEDIHQFIECVFVFVYSGPPTVGIPELPMHLHVGLMS